jgi:hypothetical protein
MTVVHRRSGRVDGWYNPLQRWWRPVTYEIGDIAWQKRDRRPHERVLLQNRDMAQVKGLGHMTFPWSLLPRYSLNLICLKLPILAPSFPNPEDVSSHITASGYTRVLYFQRALINIRGLCRSSLCSFGYFLLGLLTTPWIFGCIFPKCADLDMLMPKESARLSIIFRRSEISLRLPSQLDRELSQVQVTINTNARICFSQPSSSPSPHLFISSRFFSFCSFGNLLP